MDAIGYDVRQCKKMVAELKEYTETTTAIVRAQLEEIQKVQARIADDQARIAAIIASLTPVPSLGDTPCL